MRRRLNHRNQGLKKTGHKLDLTSYHRMVPQYTLTEKRINSIRHDNKGKFICFSFFWHACVCVCVCNHWEYWDGKLCVGKIA